MDTCPPISIIDAFAYDPDTGVFIRERQSGPAKAGDRGDRLDHKGYLRVAHQGKTYLAHRLAWLFAHGEWPQTLIDHKNCNKTDNRLCNLRLADFSQNSINAPSKGALPRGVVFHRPSGKYQAQIKSNGRTYYLGLHDRKEAAHAAYTEASHRLHGEFARCD